MLERISEIADGIAQRAEQSEELGRLHDDSVGLLREAGVIRMLQPLKWGGFEAHPVDFLESVMGVAAIVLNDGGTEDQAIAALLHDTVEDHPDQIRFEDIEREFGAAVGLIVRAATEPAGLKGSWQAQKSAYVDHIVQAPAEARRVILADKLDNARSVGDALARWGDAYWTRFSSPTRSELHWYHRTLRTRLEAWPGDPLHNQLNRLLEEFSG